jgi:hypothetical protein
LRVGDLLVGVGAGLGHGGVAVGLGGLGALLGRVRAVLGGGQFLVHLLGGGVGLGAELVRLGGAALGVCRLGLGGHGALLGGGTHRLHLRLAAVGSVSTSIRSRSSAPRALIRSASVRRDRSSSAPPTFAIVTGLASSALP